MHNFITYEESDFPSHIHKLKSLYIELFSGGKGFRARLVTLLADPLALPNNTSICLQKVVEYIHNSSLLHDDLIDGSPLRRGKTAAWKNYGPDHAVLAGDFLLAKVISLLSKNTNIELVSYTADVIMNLIEGEWIQDDIRHKTNISMADINHVHNLKTASLKKWCLRAPFYALNNTDEKLHALLEEIGRLMGVLFQRADDLIDYDIRNTENKNILGDHKSGYLNSFAIFALQEQSDNYKKDFLQLNELEKIQEYIGNTNWQNKIKAFDEINTELVNQYNNELNKLEELLTGKEKEICTQLLPLGHLLYWRK